MSGFSSEASSRGLRVGPRCYPKTIRRGSRARESARRAAQKKRPRFPGAALESEALRLALELLLDHGLAAAAVLDDHLFGGAVVTRMAPTLMPAAIAVLDDDRLAHIAVTHAVMITMMT